LGSGPDPGDIAAFAAARARVLENVAAACARSERDPSSVELVAVSKTIPAGQLVAAVAAGMTVLGENRVQEAQEKAPLVPGATWHLVGPLQSNKARRALELFDVIETIDSLDLAARIDRLVAERAADALSAPGGAVRAPFPVYLQVNVDRDPAKAGFQPELLERALPELAALPHLELRGLMTVGLLAATPEEARPTFARLRELSGRLRALSPTLGQGLSMGMSGDYAVAVEEGATLIRVGRALFGERQR
jgi:PLP dependent protein